MRGEDRGGMEREVVGKLNSQQEMPCTVGLFHQDTYNLETAIDRSVCMDF